MSPRQARKQGAPITKDPPTDARRKVRDRLVAKHGSLYQAAQDAEPPMREGTLRRWIYTVCDFRRMDLRTADGFKSLGVALEDLATQQ